MTNGYTAQVRSIGNRFLNGVAAGAVIIALSCSSVAVADEADQSNAVTASAVAVATVSNASTANAAIPIDEVNRYFLRMMTQIFDGAEDFSRTQVASFARMRKNNESLTLLDFGDGAVVISDPSGLSAGGFANVSGTELGLVYNYDTKSIGGTSPLARFHNEFVRPQLDRAPGLGADANWATTIPATALGIAGLTGAGVGLDLSRQYFIYDGKPMVLVEYLIPAISYNTPGGTDVIHWGRGFALSDPGFGMIYANVALHRSTASEPDGSLRPYRFYRASFASGDNGKPMIDIVKIPQVAKIYDDYFGKHALEVIPYSEVGFPVDQTPIKFAANLDIMAMAIGENGANDNSVLAAAQTGANRGGETAKPTPEQYRFEGRPPTEGAKKMPDGGLIYQGPRTKEEMAKIGAKPYTVGSQPGAASGSSDPAVFPHERVFESGGAKRDPKAPYPAEATTQDEGAAQAIERQVLELAPPDSRDGGGGGGAGEGSKSGKGSGGGNSGDQAERKAEEKAQSAQPPGGPLTTSTLTISDFGTKPVSFNPVKFDPVTFDDDQDLFVRNEDGTTSLKKVGPDDFVRPEFIPPEFRGPKNTEIEWTNFDDDDYPGGDSVPAFGYETMSGKIATDLAPWEEWLATQDIRKLERLARQAGYPNLASMLTDAANIIRQSQDKGYRKWALTAPACGGLIGCGPSYLERWAMKRSTLALGDILNQSRDVFSTGGLSDIAISGEGLAYMLRDFGVQDGDIVDVLIQQFGKTIFTGRVNLTNAGEAFRLQLRRGVAQLTLTAVNEGFSSPNTAEINIDQVTRGDGRQTYSLNTGQSATLRIETNRPRGN